VRRAGGGRRLATGCAVAGVALLAGVGGGAPGRPVASAGPHGLSLETTIASPRPFFPQLSGQGPALSGDHVVWTATTGPGQAGSAANRLYAYDLAARRLSVAVRSRYGALGFIGSYALIGTKLAYVDTGFLGPTAGPSLAPGWSTSTPAPAAGTFVWQVSIVDLHSGRTHTIAAAPRTARSSIAPQISFDGTKVLMLETVDLSGARHDSMALLYTLAQHRWQLLQRARNVLFADPALAHNTALWTRITYGVQVSSHLIAYNLARLSVRHVPVGDVSQVAASGDLVVWKSGMTGVGGHIGLYSLQRNRVLATDLAHSNRAIFPSIDGRIVAWTYADGSRVQVYRLSSRRVSFTTPVVLHRIYGLTAVSGHAASWTYTVLATGKRGARGYVVVRRIR
jgi:hypothetical protein